MPNTFLNTGRTVRATSNPQQNVQQVQPNAQPVVQNNPTPTTNQTNTTAQPTTQTAQNNAINPITIPIQIQPTVANQNGQQVQPQSNIQSLYASGISIGSFTNGCIFIINAHSSPQNSYILFKSI